MVGYIVAPILTAALAYTSPTFHQSAQNSNHKDQKNPSSSIHSDAFQFQVLCQKLAMDGAVDNCSMNTRSTGLLYLATDENGVRGVHVRERVEEGQEVLRVPLAHCLRDDRPPQWLDEMESFSHDDDYETHVDKWSTRLAASVIDLQFQQKGQLDEVKETWLSLLPDPLTLRASLPVHWSEEALASTGCTALQMASDAAYFTRAEAVNAILDGYKTVQETISEEDSENTLGESEIQQALDLVQTRSCRVKRHDGFGPTLRLMAPLFDFINHGGTKANAGFELEDDSLDNMYVISSKDSTLNRKPALVVRATKTIEADTELLINYGDSAKPEWKCLSSYGFIPSLTNLIDEESDEDFSSAEVYMNGKRYEINSAVIPTDLVLDVADILRAEEGIDIDEENPLSPAVALHIATRVSDVACQLIDQEIDDARSPAEQQAFESAASFRRAQHEVLVACAAGLREYATRLS